MNTMTRIRRIIFLALAGMLLAGTSVTMAGTDATSASDLELAKRHQEFESFAQSKVRQLNDNYKFSRSRMEFIKQGDGTYRARYHEIDDASVKLKVRRSTSSVAPYVAILSYREQVYESMAKSLDDFNDGMFAVVEIIPNRQIFSYHEGAWK